LTQIDVSHQSSRAHGSSAFRRSSHAFCWQLVDSHWLLAEQYSPFFVRGTEHWPLRHVPDWHQSPWLSSMQALPSARSSLQTPLWQLFDAHSLLAEQDPPFCVGVAEHLPLRHVPDWHQSSRLQASPRPRESLQTPS
jgi:hypothetical protein